LIDFFLAERLRPSPAGRHGARQRGDEGLVEFAQHDGAKVFGEL
jgi:hypothetical protein